MKKLLLVLAMTFSIFMLSCEKADMPSVKYDNMMRASSIKDLRFFCPECNYFGSSSKCPKCGKFCFIW